MHALNLWPAIILKNKKLIFKSNIVMCYCMYFSHNLLLLNTMICLNPWKRNFHLSQVWRKCNEVLKLAYLIRSKGNRAPLVWKGELRTDLKLSNLVSQIRGTHWTRMWYFQADLYVRPVERLSFSVWENPSIFNLTIFLPYISLFLSSSWIIFSIIFVNKYLVLKTNTSKAYFLHSAE